MKFTIFNKTLIMLMIIISLAIMFISNNFIKWIMMECYTLMFIAFLNFNNSQKIPSLLYFIISSLSSLIFFFNMILSTSYFNLNSENLMIINTHLIYLSMLMKIGVLPFSLWMLYSFPMLNWLEILIISTITKIMPIYVLTTMTNINFIMYNILLFNSIISSILAFNEISMKKIIMYSSMNHSSLMIIMSYTNSSIFIMYMFMYFFNSLFLMKIFYDMNLKSKINLYKIISYPKLNFLYKILIFSYSMLPPLSSFLLKWMFFSYMINSNYEFFYLMIISISSVMFIWSYLNLSNFQLMELKPNMMMIMKFTFKYKFIYMITLSFLLNNMFFLFLIFK